MESRLTQVLAIWGAVVSTIAIIWNIVRDIRNKGRLKLHPWIGTFDNRGYLGITITNRGRRPISLKCWGIVKEGEDDYYEDLNLTLKESQSIDRDDQSALPLALKSIYVLDSTGKKWKVRRWSIWKLKKQIKQARKGNSMA